MLQTQKPARAKKQTVQEETEHPQFFQTGHKKSQNAFTTSKMM
jgi:hypothetical protein